MPCESSSHDWRGTGQYLVQWSGDSWIPGKQLEACRDCGALRLGDYDQDPRLIVRLTPEEAAAIHGNAE